MEDIVDSGHTAKKLKQYLIQSGARSVRLVALLDKSERRSCDVEIDYLAFWVSKQFGDPCLHLPYRILGSTIVLIKLASFIANMFCHQFLNAIQFILVCIQPRTGFNQRLAFATTPFLFIFNAHRSRPKCLYCAFACSYRPKYLLWP